MDWDFSGESWVGGYYFCRNESGGYHGIEKQWWDYYMKDVVWPNVLLVSENEDSKADFKSTYPQWNFDITNLPHDICRESLGHKKYDLIICQATLEHLYDPFSAIYLMAKALKKDGIMVIHTHAQKAGYHAWPRDYFRFMDDWWVDIQKKLGIELLEFKNVDNNHVFACYKKKE